MPKFVANVNYIPQSPPSSMKPCNKSATVKFHMELLLILPPVSNLGVVRHLKEVASRTTFLLLVINMPSTNVFNALCFKIILQRSIPKKYESM